MKLRILVLDRAYIGHDLDWSTLSGQGELLIRDFSDENALPGILVEAAADIVVANRTQFGSGLLSGLAVRSPGRPRLICLCATGTNTVDLAAAKATGIAVCNVVGYSTDAVAQQTFALVLQILNQPTRFDGLARTWHQRCAATPAGQPSPAWTPLDLPINELAGKTWGIIGLGAIGRRVAGLAQAFGCRVIWASASGAGRDEPWPRASLTELLTTSDIVSIHSPVNDRTRGLLGTPQLTAMKKQAVLVNVGRGGIVDEAALAKVLEQGHLAGAALDVLWPEPPEAANPLFGLPSERLILTPHIAWATVQARQRLLSEIALNIEDWRAGGRRNRVD